VKLSNKTCENIQFLKVLQDVQTYYISLSPKVTKKSCGSVAVPEKASPKKTSTLLIIDIAHALNLSHSQRYKIKISLGNKEVTFQQAILFDLYLNIFSSLTLVYCQSWGRHTLLLNVL
jgi:hypothetical protein